MKGIGTMVGRISGKVTFEFRVKRIWVMDGDDGRDEHR